MKSLHSSTELWATRSDVDYRDGNVEPDRRIRATIPTCCFNICPRDLAPTRVRSAKKSESESDSIER